MHALENDRHHRHCLLFAGDPDTLILMTSWTLLGLPGLPERFAAAVEWIRKSEGR